MRSALRSGPVDDSHSGPVVMTTIVGLELPEKGERAAVAVGQLEEARVPPPPAVREHDLPDVVAGHQQVADVVDLHVEGARVAGEAGRQLYVAHASPVEERLVDPVGGGVEPGASDRGMEPERVTEDVGGPLGLVRLDPAGAPVGRIEEPGLEPGRGRPPALDPPVRPDLDPPVDPLPGRQGLAGPGDQHAGVGLDPAEVAAVELYGVGLLAGRAGRELPRQAGPAVAETQDVVAEMLDPEVGRSVHAGEVMIMLGEQYNSLHPRPPGLGAARAPWFETLLRGHVDVGRPG